MHYPNGNTIYPNRTPVSYPTTPALPGRPGLQQPVGFQQPGSFFGSNSPNLNTSLQQLLQQLIQQLLGNTQNPVLPSPPSPVSPPQELNTNALQQEYLRGLFRGNDNVSFFSPGDGFSLQDRDGNNRISAGDTIQLIQDDLRSDARRITATSNPLTTQDVAQLESLGRIAPIDSQIVSPSPDLPVIREGDLYTIGNVQTTGAVLIRSNELPGKFEEFRRSDRFPENATRDLITTEWGYTGSSSTLFAFYQYLFDTEPKAIE